MKKRHTKELIIAITILLAIIAGLSCIVLFKEKQPEFIYKDNLDKTVIIINDKEIKLADISYYVAELENRFQQMATAYNPKNPKEFWNKHFSAGTDSAFTYEYAKKEAEKLCIYYYVMEMEAASKDIFYEGLDSTCKAAASKFYDKLTAKGKENTSLTLDSILVIERRQELVKDYVKALDKVLKSKDSNFKASYLNYDGEFYTTQILTKYNITTTEVWNQVRLGDITVN